MSGGKRDIGKRPNMVTFLAVLGLLAVIELFFGLRAVREHSVHVGGSPNQRVPEYDVDLHGQKVTVLTNTPHIRSAEALAEWFNRETGASVHNVVVSYEEMLEATLEDVASEDPRLDVVMIWYADLGRLATAGALMDLTEFIAQNEAVIQPDDFIPSLYDPYTLCEGRRWALPYDGDTHALFYNRDILGRHGLNPPETWEDYSMVARTVTLEEGRRGVYGTAMMAYPEPMLIVSTYMNRLGSFGGTLFGENGRPALNSPEAVAALEAMVEHARYALPTPLETDFDVCRDAFMTGRVAMVEQWTDIGIMAEDPSQSMIAGRWGMVRIPKGPEPAGRHSQALNSGFSLAISSRAPNLETARHYLLYAVRADVTLELNLINGGIDPTRTSVLQSEAYRQFSPGSADVVKAALAAATPWPTGPDTPELLGVLARNLALAMEGLKTPRAALEDTQEAWLDILEDSPGWS